MGYQIKLNLLKDFLIIFIQIMDKSRWLRIKIKYNVKLETNI